MRCLDRDQAEGRAKDAQADTLSSIGAWVRRADGLDEAAMWLHGDDVGHVRAAIAGMRQMIVAARDIEAALDIANHYRRTREAAHRDAVADESIKIEVRPR